MKSRSEKWQASRKLLENWRQLRNNCQKIQPEFKTATKAIHELQRSVQRYNFKNQAALQKINQILEHNHQ